MVYTYKKINQNIYLKCVLIIVYKLNLSRFFFFLVCLFVLQEIQVHFQEENLTFAPRRRRAAEQNMKALTSEGLCPNLQAPLCVLLDLGRITQFL